MYDVHGLPINITALVATLLSSMPWSAVAIPSSHRCKQRTVSYAMRAPKPPPVSMLLHEEGTPFAKRSRHIPESAAALSPFADSVDGIRFICLAMMWRGRYRSFSKSHLLPPRHNESSPHCIAVHHSVMVKHLLERRASVRLGDAWQYTER